MKKIFKFSLGVVGIFNMLVASAIERFEILPDLPEPLTMAVQPAAQAAVVKGATDVNSLGTQSIGHEPSIISVVLSLIFVILLIYLTGIVYAKLNKVGYKTLKKQNAETTRSQVSVVSTTQLGNNKSLHVVELDGKRMLIGASSSTIQLIKDLGTFNENIGEDEYSHIEIPHIKIPKIEIPKIEIPSINFSKLSTKTHKPINEVEAEDNITLNEHVETQPESISEETSDIIIDSLFAQKPEIEQPIEENKQSEHIVDPDDYALYKKYLG